MKKKKILYLTVQQFVFLIYFFITTTIFFLSLNQGTQGVSIRLFGGGDDGYFYWEQAKIISKGHDVALTSIYPLIIGYIIKITGIDSVYLIRIFNYFGFILLLLLSYLLINMQFKLDSRELKREHGYNAKTILLFSFLFYASLQMNVNLSIYRDIWIYTLYSLTVILSIKVIFYKNYRLINFIFLLPSLWLLGEFRNYALMSFILAVALYFLINWLKRLYSTNFILGVIIVFFGIYYTFLYSYSLPIVNMSMQQALSFRNSSITDYSGGSQMWISLDQSFYPQFLLNYIHSYIGNFIGPLPWHINGLSNLFVFFVETIPMTIILYFLWEKRRDLSKVQGYVLLHAFVWIGLIAVTNDNVGTATRLRPVSWILILLVFVTVYSKSGFLNKKN